MPRPTPADELAITVWNMLANGSGGLDWAGLPIVAAWLGVDDVDGLLLRLHTIRTHRPQQGSRAQ